MSSSEAIVKNAEQEEKFPAELIAAVQSAVDDLRQRSPGDHDVCRILGDYLVRRNGSQFSVETIYSSDVRYSKVHPIFVKLERILELIVSGKTVEIEEPRPLADLQKEAFDAFHRLLENDEETQRSVFEAMLKITGFGKR